MSRNDINQHYNQHIIFRNYPLLQRATGIYQGGADKLTNRMIDESGFNQSKFQMSIYYKYSLDGSNLVVLYYVDDCVNCYKFKELGKWFVDTLGKIFHVKLLGYAH